jgi:hypothetical protein
MIYSILSFLVMNGATPVFEDVADVIDVEWKMNLKYINITPPHTLDFEHMAVAHKVHFQYTENTFTTNFDIMW